MLGQGVGVGMRVGVGMGVGIRWGEGWGVSNTLILGAVRLGVKQAGIKLFNLGGEGENMRKCKR